jgi:hypothetical protein
LFLGILREEKRALSPFRCLFLFCLVKVKLS